MAVSLRAHRPRVVALALDQIVAWGVLYYTYSVLRAPLAQAFDVSDQFVAFAFSLSLAVSGLLAAPVGRLLDRRGARGVLLVGVGVGPVAFAALAFAPNWVALLAVFACLGFAQALALYEPAFRAVVSWYPTDQERNRALLVLTSIAGFSSTIFLPLSAFLLEHLQWRTTTLVLALLLALVSIPIRLGLPRGEGVAAVAEFTPRPGVHSPAAAVLFGLGFAFQAFAGTAVMLCLPLHFVEVGEPLGRAATLAGLAGAAQVPGRLLLAPLQRIVGSRLRVPLLFALQGFALIGIVVATWPIAIASMLLFGAIGGSMTLEKAVVVLEWFGATNFGSRSGLVASFALLARAAAPIGAEVLRTAMDGYAGAFYVLGALLVVGGGVVFAAHIPLRTSRSAR